MDHVAIMNPSWKLIQKIIAGKKTIESRWYQTRRTPWNNVQRNDRVFFKDAGKLVTATARITDVHQFEVKNLDDVVRIVKKYGKDICLINPEPRTWERLPKYCILIHLKDPAAIKQPFAINKKGFGAGAAWLTVKNINQLRPQSK